MNLTVLCGAAATVAVATWHFAGAPRKPAYDIPIETAEARLKAMTFEEGMLTGLPFSRSQTGEGAARRLSWDFAEPRSGRSSACTVALEAEAPGRTTADLSCAVEGRKLDPEQAELSGKLLELVVSEHVAASLAGRPFDHSSMGGKLIAFSLTHRAAFARRAASQFEGAQAMPAQ